MRTASPGFIAGLTEAPTKGIKPRRFLCLSVHAFAVAAPVRHWRLDG